MTTPILFKEYIWLVETIHKAGKITLAELNERWLDTDSLHAEFEANLRRIRVEFTQNCSCAAIFRSEIKIYSHFLR